MATGYEPPRLEVVGTVSVLTLADGSPAGDQTGQTTAYQPVYIYFNLSIIILAREGCPIIVIPDFPEKKYFQENSISFEIDTNEFWQWLLLNYSMIKKIAAVFYYASKTVLRVLYTRIQINPMVRRSLETNKSYYVIKTSVEDLKRGLSAWGVYV